MDRAAAELGPGRLILKLTLARPTTSDISDLAKSIVRKWKEAVEESKKRKAESQDGEESAKKKAKGEASGASL